MLSKLINSFFDETDILSVPKSKQLKFMNSLGNPSDDVERSYFQYKCQMKKKNMLKKIVLFFASLGMIFIECLKKNKVINNKSSVNNLLLFVHDLENVPPQYKKDSYKMIESFTGYKMDGELRKYLKHIKKKHRFSLFFWVKITKKLKFYNYLIQTYSPKIIITANEYSFTSSILTNYCEFNNIPHINVMHGEKIFYWRDSFFRFSKMYVWDKSYVKLFHELKTSTNDFEVYLPKTRFIVPIKKEQTMELTYYLQEQNFEEMKKIEKNLSSLSYKDKIAIRPHPRYTDIADMNKVFNKYVIENPNEISIQDSLSRTKIVVSLYSTVLLQAYFSGMKYLIDDLSDKEKFIKLKELDYYLIDDEKTLSKYLFLNDNKNKEK